MNKQLWGLEVEELKALYVQESLTLTNAVLQGVDWELLEDQRKKVSELSKIIDYKREGFSLDPSRIDLRKTKN